MSNGEQHWTGKLDWQKVRDIRRRSAEICPGCGETLTNVQLARQFGISTAMVHKILKNKSWRIESDPKRQAVYPIISASIAP